MRKSSRSSSEHSNFSAYINLGDEMDGENTPFSGGNLSPIPVKDPTPKSKEKTEKSRNDEEKLKEIQENNNDQNHKNKSFSQAVEKEIAEKVNNENNEGNCVEERPVVQQIDREIKENEGNLKETEGIPEELDKNTEEKIMNNNEINEIPPEIQEKQIENRKIEVVKKGSNEKLGYDNLVWRKSRHNFDDICDICGNGDSWEIDAIYICDLCHCTAHQTCYGVGLIERNNEMEEENGNLNIRILISHINQKFLFRRMVL